MTTQALIDKLNCIAQIGIVNARQDVNVLLEAAERLHELREKLDPKWAEWLIMDEGLFLAAMNGEESEWTDDKDDAQRFDNQADAQEFIDNILGYGFPALRGDHEPMESFSIEPVFNCDESTFPSAEN